MPQSFTPFPPRRKPPSNQPLADLVGPCIGATLGRHGFGEADVLLHWPEIVGADLADRCRPLRLQWRRRQGGTATEPATLVVRVESASALTLQHMERVVVERVNSYLGWRCVGRLALRQGPLPETPRRARRAAAPSAPTIAHAKRLVGSMEDAALEAALVRFGAQVLGRREPP